MIPTNMPLPEVQSIKQQSVPSNAASKQERTQEDFDKMLDSATIHGQEDTKKLLDRQEQVKTQKQQDATADQETTDTAAAEHVETNQKKNADLKDQAEAAADKKADQGEQIQDAEKTEKTERTERTEKTAKRRQERDEDDPIATPWSLVPTETPVATVLHPQLAMETVPGGVTQQTVDNAVAVGQGGGKGIWIPNPTELAMTELKSPHAAAGRGGREATSPITELGLQNQRSSSTSNPVIQHASKAALPAHAPTFGEDLAEQIGTLRLISRPGMSEQVRINLVPRDLGNVDVRLQVDDENRVHILITAETEAAKDLLNKQMPQLREALARQNFGFGEIAVQVDQRQKGDSSGQGFEWRGGGRGSLPETDEPNTAGFVPMTRTNQPWTSAQGLSVFA
ncbi:MAG: flagellar hook-length control protein FliK [Magnetococcales bacterium]|nr:flagellar hook-length control protein FliK [Magnetococcales bacterium]